MQLYIYIINGHSSIEHSQITLKNTQGSLREKGIGKQVSSEHFLKEAMDVELHRFSEKSFKILGELKAKPFLRVIESTVKRENCQLLMVSVTKPGSVGKTSQ